MQNLVFTDVVQKYYAELDKGDIDGVVALFEVDAEYSSARVCAYERKRGDQILLRG